MSIDVKDSINPIVYLKTASELLSNPISAASGRDMVIRALDERKKYHRYDSILKHLVKKAGLFPYLQSEFDEHDLEDIVTIEANKPVAGNDIVFHATQTRVFNQLRDGKNVVLSAPTSMGKSEILANMLSKDRYHTVVLIVPTIALIDETRKKLATSLDGLYRIIHHNSQHYEDTVPTIFVLTQERANQRSDIENVDLFIIDEFYKLGFKYNSEGFLKYDERAISLNISLSQLLKKSKQWFFIGPNITNVRGLSRLVGDFTFICSDFRTVSVDVKDYDIAASDAEMKKKILLQILKECEGEKTIVYCRSPKSANKLAQLLMTEGEFEEQFEGEFIDWLSKTYDSRWNYCKALKHGVVLHHGVLPRALQHFSVDIFNRSRRHNVLICTSTIIEGVNTRAKNVVIYENYNGLESIDKFTHNNIKGRAGRMYKHFVGRVYCLQSQPGDDASDELVIPIGDEDCECPLNLLGSIDREHLSSGGLEAWERFSQETDIPTEIIRNNSSFEVEKIECLLRALENVQLYDFELYKQLNFFKLPTTDALYFIMEQFIEARKKVLTRNGFSVTPKDGKDPVTSICGKFRAFLAADSVEHYLKQQMEWKHKQLLEDDCPQNEFDEQMSGVIDDELKIISNVYGFSFPNFLSLFGDILYFLNKKESTGLTFDYSHIISDMENQKLTAGYAAIHEMGVPHQTLKLLREKLIDVDEASVDDISLAIKTAQPLIESFSRVDRYFIKSAKL
ncbi:TPA: DEAD/DEAH box helicase [Vibrio diabolicus]|uniref:DEAD/DEAH box helicase n=3 Tax=Vibrio diabolicus subgroup TaxID=2315253 RepID=UPI00215F538C|nr:DEAD/DEAH box helicase [Vibrio diabolicus]MCS0392740.1 DEAD/DEAH box helicase [Vibrio diabolicus]